MKQGQATMMCMCQMMCRMLYSRAGNAARDVGLDPRALKKFRNVS